jgi:hypothetical protein
MRSLEAVPRVSEHGFGWRIPGEVLGLSGAFSDDKGVLAHVVLFSGAAKTLPRSTAKQNRSAGKASSDKAARDFAYTTLRL